MNGGHEYGEAFGDLLGFARQIDDEATSADSGRGTREDRPRHFIEALGTKNLAKTRQFAFEDGASRFGGDIAGANAGAAGGDNEIAAAMVGQFAQGLGDPLAVVGEHDRFDLDIGAKHFTQDMIDPRPAAIFIDPGAGAVAQSDSADFHNLHRLEFQDSRSVSDPALSLAASARSKLATSRPEHGVSPLVGSGDSPKPMLPATRTVDCQGSWPRYSTAMTPSNRSLRLATHCIHAGTHLDETTGGACSPIFTSTAYAYPNPANENVYPRYFNVPNQRVINRKLAALERGEDALVFGSGMAAISTLLFAHLKPGDHAAFQADLYGGTHQLVTTELVRLGIAVSFSRTAEEIAAALRPNTRLIYVESPSNPLLRCVDLAAVARLGRARGLLTIIDNTFATPINQNPIELGIDAIIHSATKYLNGHSDVNAGVVVSSSSVIRTLTESAMLHGGMLDAHACYQLERGMKTLVVRVRQHNENAGRLARFLQSHPAVARVNYPGLPEHPDYAIAARQMRGFGGMLSFELRDPGQVDGVLSRLRVVMPALSLGGVESLVCVPSRTSHRKLSPAERQGIGISDGLVRVSVGIEDIEDLVEDFGNALR